MLLAAVIPLIRFFIMNIAVCFLEKVKINMLFKFLYFHCNTFFFTEHARSPRTSLSNWMLDFAHDRRGTSTNVLLHPYSRRTLPTLTQLHCFSASLLLHWRVSSLQLLWHTCSHSQRDYGQVPDNWLIFVDYLLVIYLR
jgi:hypothetical protein